MRILHLSDLHLTGPFKNFEEIWSGPSPHLVAGSFDFVLVSGDLSQRAAPHEYEQLRVFLNRSVLPLLKEPQLHRIVLVPGNHDVDWSADIGDRLSIEEQLAADESFGSKLRRAPFEPGFLRVSIGRYGHLDVLRIDPNRYPSRFKNVQDFLTAFYKDVPSSEHFRSFDLTNADETNHWSAHVFPASGIAFYGFSSCHGNDRYWTGAMLNARAIEQARLHAEKYARDCTRIAVWHHGLGSDRGRPDYLSTQDIGLLYNAGFRIGFHGHTHRAASKALDELFKNRFFIISTGSLGAGAEERPDAVGNQFSIAEVHHPSHVDVEVFSRDGTSGSFERNREKRRHTFLEPATPRLDQLSHAVSHQRTWTVTSDGIARIDVELRDVTLYGEVLLAVIEPPFCSVQGRDKAETSTGQLPVMRTELPDGRIRFALNTGKDVKLDWLRWSYHVSNGVALNQMDLEARGKSHSSLDHLLPGFDGRSYTVRFPCEELSLIIRFSEKPRLEKKAVQAVALRRVEVQGQERWERNLAAEQRWALENDEQQVRLRIPSPLVDHRYLLASKLAEVGERYEPDERELLKWLLEQCRDQVSAPDSMVAAFTQAVGGNLERVLEASFTQESSWAVYLWHPERHSLMTAFGRFPNRAWAVRFAWGEGVAGHALRFGLEAGWVRGDSSHHSLIFRPNPKASPEGDYSWIVCFPLLTSLQNSANGSSQGRAIGVLGFAGNARGGPAEQQLREYASYVARLGNRPMDDQQFSTFRDRLFSAVHSAFWEVLRSWKSLTPRRRAQVQQICDKLGVPPAPVDPASSSKP